MFLSSLTPLSSQCGRGETRWRRLARRRSRPKWGCSNRGGQLPDGTPRLLGHRQDVAHLARHVLQVVSKVIWHTHMVITLSMSSSPANCDMMRGSRCIPLLVQLLHLDPAHPANPRPSRPVRARGSQLAQHRARAPHGQALQEGGQGAQAARSAAPVQRLS